MTTHRSDQSSTDARRLHEMFNYAPVAVLVVLGFAGVWWLVSARTWFTGPKVQGTPEELAAIERDLIG